MEQTYLESLLEGQELITRLQESIKDINQRQVFYATELIRSLNGCWDVGQPYHYDYLYFTYDKPEHWPSKSFAGILLIEDKVQVYSTRKDISATMQKYNIKLSEDGYSVLRQHILERLHKAEKLYLDTWEENHSLLRTLDQHKGNS